MLTWFNLYFNHGVELLISLAPPTASSRTFFWLFVFCLYLFFQLNSHMLTLFNLCFDHGVKFMVYLASPKTFYRTFFRLLVFCLPLFFPNEMSYAYFFLTGIDFLDSVVFDSVCFLKWIVISLHCSTSVSMMTFSFLLHWLHQGRLNLFVFGLCLCWFFALVAICLRYWTSFLTMASR